MKSEHQKRIEKFMGLANRHIPLKPEIPDKETRLLRSRLIIEEALETVESLGFDLIIRDTWGNPYYAQDGQLEENNKPVLLENIAKELGDLSFVTYGTFSACGIDDKPIIEAVDQNNLDKFNIPQCTNGHGEMIELKKIHEYYCRECNEMAKGPYIREDGKFCKSPTHPKPDIKSLIEAQIGN